MEFKKLFWLVLMLFAIGCYDSSSSGDSGNVESGSQAIKGTIVDENGQPVSGVNVEAQNSSVYSERNGTFFIIASVDSKNRAVLTLGKDGYFTTYKNVTCATGDTNYIKIVIYEKTLIGTIEAGQEANLNIKNGAHLNIPADGLEADETVNVYANYISPDAEDMIASMPGGLSALDYLGNDVSLLSYGVVMLSVEDQQTGLQVKLKEGKQAEITFPAIDETPSEVALWVMDSVSGLWDQVSKLIKNVDEYVALINSPNGIWNCDDWGTPAKVSGSVLYRKDLSPVDNCPVIVKNGPNNLTFYTSSSGDYEFEVASGFAFQIIVPTNDPVMISPLYEYEELDLPAFFIDSIGGLVGEWQYIGQYDHISKVYTSARDEWEGYSQEEFEEITTVVFGSNFFISSFELQKFYSCEAMWDNAMDPDYEVMGLVDALYKYYYRSFTKGVNVYTEYSQLDEPIDSITVSTSIAPDPESGWTVDHGIMPYVIINDTLIIYEVEENYDLPENMTSLPDNSSWYVNDSYRFVKRK